MSLKNFFRRNKTEKPASRGNNTDTGIAIGHPAGNSVNTLMSKLCVQEDFQQPWYASICAEIREPARFHRKQWEFVAIIKALRDRGMLEPGRRGIGFGVGTEPLPSLFAKHGCEIVATDLDVSDGRSKAWTNGNQLLTHVAALNERSICPEAGFQKLVSYRAADMNRIPADLRDFDFSWSSCAFEHLGSIEKGLDFYLNQMETLRPGGWAAHTTEFNVVSDHDTVDNEDTVLFRKQDIRRLLAELERRGFRPEPISYQAGNRPLDYYVDVAPYSGNHHLKLRLKDFVTTSVLILCQK